MRQLGEASQQLPYNLLLFIQKPAGGAFFGCRWQVICLLTVVLTIVMLGRALARLLKSCRHKSLITLPCRSMLTVTVLP